MALGYQPMPPPRYTPRAPDPYYIMAMMQAQQRQKEQQAKQGGGMLDGLAELGAGGYLGSEALSSGTPAATGIFSATAPEAAADAYLAGANLGGEVATPNVISATRVPAEVPGMFDFSGIGSAGNAILPLAGAYGAYDLFSNKRTGARGGLQGAASGAAIGSYFGPQGALIGAGIGGLSGLLNRYGDKDKWKTEGKRLNKLKEKGVKWLDIEQPTRGRSKEELVAIEEAKLARGEYGNPEFARTRDEKSLRPEDIWGYATFGEKFGNDWLGKFSEQERKNIAQKALDSGAVREHHGTIDIDWDKVNLDNKSQTAAPNTVIGSNGNMIPRLNGKSTAPSSQSSRIPRKPARFARD